MKPKTPFTVYDASAGSGKTFTLVVNYLSIVLTSPQQDAFKNVLAITFTNKAVHEMKSRIIETLTAFTQPTIPANYHAIGEQVQQKTGLSEADIHTRSQQLLQRILHNYAAFEVSTIDGFTHRVLRTFAKDLGIPMNFEVELDTDAILEEAVDRLIAQAGKDKKLTRTLIYFALAKADDDKSWDVSRDLYAIAKLLINENNLHALTQLRSKTLTDFEHFKKELKQHSQQTEAKVLQLADDFFQLLETHQIEETSFNRGSIPKYFKEIQEKVFSKHLKTSPKWRENVDSAKLHVTKTPKQDKIALDKLQPEIAALVNNSVQLLFQLDFYQEVLKKLTPLSLLTAISQEVEKIKKERKLLLISEFNYEIAKSIQGQPAPFIYERLGERYRHYFIDEFQDTSVLQWQNLIPLIDHSLASGTGTLSLIGDAKQSIYRWRGGKAEQLMELSNGKSLFVHQQEKETLPANFRSAQAIVDFNNRFFKHTASFLSFEPYQQLFENAHQEIKKEDPGYVRLDFIEANNKAETMEVYPEKVLQLIRELEQQHYSKSDMCILVRKRDQGVALANYLTEHDIPIISSETLLIEQSPIVQFLVNMLRFSVYPTDAHLKFELLNFIYDLVQPNLDHYAFMQRYLPNEADAFFEALTDVDLHFTLSIFQQLPFYESVEYVLRAFSLVKQADAYVQFFLDVVYEFGQKNDRGLTGFLAYWEQHKHKLSIVAPEGEDAVQIMTIHKSKGLEFPIVIYPFANQKMDDTRQDDVWVSLAKEPFSFPLAFMRAQKKMLQYNEDTAQVYSELLHQNELDSINILYVALTRAATQLYIISEQDLDAKGMEKTHSYSGLFINFLKSIDRWEEGKWTYEFGRLAAKETEKKSAEKSQHLPFYSTSPSDHNLNLITKDGSLWLTDIQQAMDEGELLHELLSRITTATDIDAALQGFIHEGLLTADAAKAYRKTLHSIVQHPELSPYFSTDFSVYNEKEIIAQGQYKRLDRLCLQGQSAVIIDYKTGSPLASHEQQINAYADAIQEMGYQVTEKKLVYINEPLTIKNV